MGLGLPLGGGDSICRGKRRQKADNCLGSNGHLDRTSSLEWRLNRERSSSLPPVRLSGRQYNAKAKPARRLRQRVTISLGSVVGTPAGLI